MRKVIHVMWGAALGFCLILSAASVMAASNETVGVVSFDTTQVFVRFTGPFLGTSNPYNHSKNDTTRVSLDANNDDIKDDWRSGLPPVEAIPNEYVFAHLFLNVMPEQVGGYNDVISARGSMEFPFRFDVRSNRMLQFRSFFQAEDGAIPGAVSLTTVFQSTAPTDFSVAVSDALEAPETYYLGAVLFQVAEIDFCKGVTTHRDEVQPIAPQVDDKPDRIADMVVRLVPPVPPQLAYEDMTKLHLLELCLTGPVDTPEGKVWTSVADEVIPASMLASHLGWNFPGVVNVPIEGQQGKFFPFDMNTLYPFPPVISFAELPYGSTNAWVPAIFTDDAISSYANLKYVVGEGLHVSYKLVDKTGSLTTVNESVTIMLAASVPSHVLPAGTGSAPGPIYVIDKNGNVLRQF